MKKFEEFAEDVRYAMAMRYKDDKVTLKRITKNNGVIYTGICVRGEKESIYPTLYLEPFYDESSDEGVSDEIIDRICDIYESRRLGSVENLNYLTDYERVRKSLRCKLINRKNNEEFLKDVPHRPFMDLAIVPYYRIKDCDLGRTIMCEGSFVIRNSHLDMWKVTAEELVRESVENTLTMEEPVITGMYELLSRLNPAFKACEGEEDLCPMYVMTTGDSYGAVAMLYEDRIRDLCRALDSDVIIIPSSINEIILIPKKGCIPEEMLNEMVCEVNETEIRPIEVLSDHVYSFERDGGYRMAG
ncbi:MAG: DUF5688 family protein [Lachnospiraceae bacterium]|nr:DUF5688 family protein [Lachnospiraceae bacterium]